MASTARSGTSVGSDLGQSLGLVGLRQGFDAAVEISFQQAGEVMDREADAMVGDAVIGEVIGANLLRSFTGPDLGAAQIAALLSLASLLLLLQPGPQDGQRLGLVLVLALLVVDGDHHAGGEAGDEQRSVGGGNSPPPLATRA